MILSFILLQCSSISIATKPLQTSHLAQCDNHNSHTSSSVMTSPSNETSYNRLCTTNHGHLAASFSSKPGISSCSGHARPLDNAGVSSCRNCDHGYGSEQDGCDNCSVPSSNDGSDIFYPDSFCSHEGQHFILLQLCFLFIVMSFIHCKMYTV